MIEGLLSSEVVELALVLFLALLIGLEREEHKALGAHYVFGGVRTFPLIGLVGYAVARVSNANAASIAIGFLGIGGLMAISYWHKVHADPTAGATTEVSGLITYLVGALVYAGAYWLAVAIGVIAVLLLELREGLENLTARVGRQEVTAFAKFLVLAIVILPVLPNQSFTRFELNPFRTWLVLVAVSGVSYASYVLQKWLHRRGGVLLTAVLGGAYSSTATTVVLARRAKEAGEPLLYAGSMLAASGMMYVRMIALVFLFDAALARVLMPWFGTFALLGLGAGIPFALRRAGASRVEGVRSPANPLELRPAFLFGATFLVVLVLTRLAIQYVGRSGLYGLAALMGLSDVDPFVLSLAQAGVHGEPVRVAAAAIVIAAAANNLMKGVYAYAFGDRASGRYALALLGALALAGSVPLMFL